MQWTVALIVLVAHLYGGVAFRGHKLSSRLGSRTLAVRSRSTELDMAVYSSAQGVPAALVEERDACGVGFIASMDQRKTHDILKQSLNALTCMEHRGATSADNVSGDGAGIMTDIPWKLFEREGVDVGAVKNADGSDATGVGQMFMPHEDTKEAMAVVDAAAETLGLNVLMWRDVPVNEQV